MYVYRIVNITIYRVFLGYADAARISRFPSTDLKQNTLSLSGYLLLSLIIDLKYLRHIQRNA